MDLRHPARDVPRPAAGTSSFTGQNSALPTSAAVSFNSSAVRQAASRDSSSSTVAEAALYGLAEAADKRAPLVMHRPIKKSAIWLERWQQDSDKENRPPPQPSPTARAPGSLVSASRHKPSSTREDRKPVKLGVRNWPNALSSMRPKPIVKSETLHPSSAAEPVAFLAHLPSEVFRPSLAEPLAEAKQISRSQRKRVSPSEIAISSDATPVPLTQAPEVPLPLPSVQVEETQQASLTRRRKSRRMLASEEEEERFDQPSRRPLRSFLHENHGSSSGTSRGAGAKCLERAAMRKALQQLMNKPAEDSEESKYDHEQSSEEDSDEYVCDTDTTYDCDIRDEDASDEYQASYPISHPKKKSREAASARTAPNPGKESSTPASRADVDLVSEDLRRSMHRVGVELDDIVRLINNEESIESYLARTGFSLAYVKKLQRRVLRNSPVLQPRPWHEHSICGKTLHVLYGKDDVPMFINKELCAILGVSDTALSYWKRKVNAEERETYQDYRLMEIYQGRATYTLFPAHSLLKMMHEMLESKQKTFETPEFEKLSRKVKLYAPAQ